MRGDERLGGRYRLIEPLGAGGMSVVWRGYDEILGRQVAIKMLASRLAADPAFRRRIRMEAQATARLCHPHITNVYDYGESIGPAGEPIPYVVMEMVHGESMAARLADGRALSWREAVTAGAQVAAALAAAHARGVVHRDITPANVMLTASGAKVLDFGISAVVGEREADAGETLLGTPAYLAPERMGRGPVSPATDVYALGLLVYQALTGRLPWHADTTTQMLRAHVYTEPAPVPPIDGLPPEVADLCLDCLAKHPDERPSSADVAHRLAAALGPAAEILSAAAPSRRGSAAGGTTALPQATVTGVAATGDGDPVVGRTRTAGRWSLRRLRPALVAATAIAVMALIWAGTAWSPGTQADAASPTAEMGAAPRLAGCEVEYRLQGGSGTTFTAQLTVKNTGTAPFPGWRLTFDLPGDQQLRHGTGATWLQDGRTLTAAANETATLGPGAAAPVAFTGTYRASNPIPVTFHLNETTCTAVLLATPAAPQTVTGEKRGKENGKGDKKDDENKDKDDKDEDENKDDGKDD